MNSVSEPPINISYKGEKVSFADVAMRVARDGPMYAVIIVVGVMAMKGAATASETIIAAAVSLLARSFPGMVQADKKAAGGIGLTAMAFTVAAYMTASCAPPVSAEYGAGLVACNGLAKLRLDGGIVTKKEACTESILCENDIRKEAKRPLRDVDAGCN